jgi:hypothetical protein
MPILNRNQGKHLHLRIPLFRHRRLDKHHHYLISVVDNIHPHLLFEVVVDSSHRRHLAQVVVDNNHHHHLAQVVVDNSHRQVVAFEPILGQLDKAVLQIHPILAKVREQVPALAWVYLLMEMVAREQMAWEA